MPRVRIDYQLPAEADELEAALLGRESVAALRALRGYLSAKLASPSATKPDYRRALVDVQKKLDELTATRDDVRGNDDDGPDDRERDEPRD